MANRLIKWFGFSILLTLLPIGLSIGTKVICNIDFSISNYNNEILFMAVMLSATSIGDLTSIMQKGAKGIHITTFMIILIFICLICISCYEIITISSFSKMNINIPFINFFALIGVSCSLVIGVVCQVSLEKVGG